jgi:hypothetical protein
MRRPLWPLRRGGAPASSSTRRSFARTREGLHEDVVLFLGEQLPGDAGELARDGDRRQYGSDGTRVRQGNRIEIRVEAYGP